MFTAIIFAIGVGYSGYSIQSAGLGTLFSLIGMLWALLGIEIQRFVLSHRRIQQQLSQSDSAGAVSEQQEQQPPPPTPRLAALRVLSSMGKPSILIITLTGRGWAQCRADYDFSAHRAIRSRFG